MEQRLVNHASRNPLATYGFAVLVSLLGLIVRLPFAGVLESKAPYITFFLATVASAFYGGLGPGLVTTACGAILALLFVLAPYELFPFRQAGEAWVLGLFVFISSFISYLIGQLKESQLHEYALRELCQQTLVSIGDAVITTDEEKRIRLINSAAEQITGWKEHEAKGLMIEHVFRIVHEGTDRPVESPVERVLATGKVVGLANHTELITRSGERIPIDDSGAPILGKDGKVMGAVLVFRDISDRRKTEKALEAAERRSREILQSITDAFMLLDENWKFVEVNAAAERIVGKTGADLIGKSHWEVYPETVGGPVESAYKKAVSEQCTVHFEFFHDQWGKWFEVTAYPSRQGLAVYFRDITERKQSEAAIQRLNEDLKQFTFAATHDVREPLRMITIYVQMLESKLEQQLDDQARGYIAQVVNGAQRISNLIAGLLEFSRIGELEKTEPRRVDSESAFREALEDLQIAIQESRARVTHEPLPEVMAEAIHVRQIFQNLIGNSLKYTKQGIVPEVHVSVRQEGKFWAFCVRDNGIGIPEKHHAQIFVPFKRLHGTEISGAGIGLATCKRMVERFGGRIWVESVEGEGAAFCFSLPAAEGVQ